MKFIRKFASNNMNTRHGNNPSLAKSVLWVGKKYIFFYDVTALITNVYIYNKIFSLAFYTHFGYHSRIVKESSDLLMFSERGDNEQILLRNLASVHI